MGKRLLCFNGRIRKSGTGQEIHRPTAEAQNHTEDYTNSSTADETMNETTETYRIHPQPKELWNSSGGILKELEKLKR